MLHRILSTVLAVSLLASLGMGASAAPASPTSELTQPAKLAPAGEAPQSYLTSEVLAQGVGAVVGFGVFSLFVAPQAAAAGGIAELLGGRLAAATLAGMGAVGATYVYDYWTGLPLDYAYFWHRGGFIMGLAGGIAVFGVMGYPLDGGTTWLGWTANRITLIGTGLVGSWITDRWYQGR